MGSDDRKAGVGTTLDPEQARPRLHDSLVPPDTGIFLRMEAGPQMGEILTLSSGGVYVIGREGADIELNDPKISRKHAELSLLGPGAFFLRDLASTNGTFVNDRRAAEKVAINNEDRIRVGDTVFTFFVVCGALVASSRR